MNKSLKIFVLASMAMATVLSCQKEANAPSEPETFHITVKTSVEKLSGEDQTRTYIDGANTILWGTGEYMKIAVKTGETTTFGTSKDDCADHWDGSDQAYFEFDLNLSDVGESYTYMGMYPASAAVSSDNNNHKKYKVALPDTQNATTASYDPEAYIMVAKPEKKDAFEGEWVASYRRATALNKVTLKNIKDDIISVEFTAADGIYMAGRRYIDLETDDSGDIYSGGGRITVKYNNEPLSDNDKVIWFTSWGTEIPTGKTFKIVAKSASKTYTRTLEVANNPICFKEGYLNILNVNMENAEVESVNDIAEGDYLILAKNKNNNYYALKAEVSGTRIASEDDYTGNLESYYGDASLIWTITPSGTSYTIKNGDNYLGYKNDGNTASLVKQEDYDDDACKMSIDDNKNGTYKISVTKYPTRILARNTSNSYFAFYNTDSQYLDLVLVPAVVDNRAEAQISWSATTANIVLNGDYASVPKFNNPNELSVNFESSNTTVATVSTEGEISIIGPGETKITASFGGDGSFKESTVTTEIRVTEEGQELIQYEKVATDYDDWTGTYLIVAEEANGAANVATGVIPKDWLLSETVQITVDNTLDATKTYDGFSVNIEKAPNSSYYIKFNGGYLGTTDSNSGIKIGSTPTSDFYWTFSYDKETNLVKITSTIGNNRHLRYNSSGGFRTYTNTTGTQATLFKRSVSLVNGGNTGNEGEGTTDPENPGGDGGEGEGDTEPEEIELTFDLTKNPNNWPTQNSNTATNYNYNLNDKSYTFSLTNCKCNSGYLMLTAPAYLGLPAIEGYKLTKVVGTGTKTASNATSVSIVTATSNGEIINGGAAQIWSDITTPGSYTYSLSETSEGTMYYMKVENKNCQCTKLVLTYHK